MGWLVPSGGQKILLSENRILQAPKGAENTTFGQGAASTHVYGIINLDSVLLCTTNDVQPFFLLIIMFSRVGARDSRTQSAVPAFFFSFTPNPSPKKPKNLKPNTSLFFSASFYPIFLIISWFFFNK
jgi:hypothetical protein